MLDALHDKWAAVSTESASRAATVAIAVVLLLLIASQCWKVYRTALFSPVVETVTTVANTASNGDYSASAITAQNLFGSSSADPDQLRHSNLPTTNLAVSLRGVFTSTNPELASAIIERPDGDTRSYKVNAVVYGDTRLHAVFNDRIVLRTDGALETLYFPEPSETEETAGTDRLALNQVPAQVQQFVRDNMSGEEIRQAARQLSNPSITPEQRKALIRERLLELRKRARENRENNK